MKSVAIIGANGFVGKALCRASSKLGFKTIRVTRQNYDELKQHMYDYVINSAMPSKRFWSLNNPVEDCTETILKTADIFYKWKYNKFIQISSISATKQLNMPYGIHKRAAEIIVENNENTLIVRLGALYGSGLLKSALFDLVNKNHIYVDINSEYNYIDVDTAAEWIMKNIDKINRLYDEGNEIVYWTARGGTTGIDWTELTRSQLEKWGAKHTELKMWKPHYDLFICDKAINAEGFFNEKA